MNQPDIFSTEHEFITEIRHFLNGTVLTVYPKRGQKLLELFKEWEKAKSEEIGNLEKIIEEKAAICNKMNRFIYQNHPEMFDKYQKIIADALNDKITSRECIEFADWILKESPIDRVNGNSDGWLYDGKGYTTEQLYEFFKNEKHEQSF